MTVVYIDTQVLDPNQADTQVSCPSACLPACLGAPLALRSPSAHRAQIIFEDPDWEAKRYAHLAWIDATLEAAAKSSTWLLVAGRCRIVDIRVFVVVCVLCDYTSGSHFALAPQAITPSILWA